MRRHALTCVGGYALYLVGHTTATETRQRVSFLIPNKHKKGNDMSIENLVTQFKHHIDTMRQNQDSTIIEFYEVADMMIPIFANGVIATHEMFERVIMHWHKFYDVITDDEINYYNRWAFGEIFGRERNGRQSSAGSNGFVYILEGGGYCKIGRTCNPNKRIAQISPKLPFDTTLVHMIPTDDSLRLEAILHERFENKRVNGEWFNLDREDIKWLTGWKKVTFSVWPNSR